MRWPRRAPVAPEIRPGALPHRSRPWWRGRTRRARATGAPHTAGTAFTVTVEEAMDRFLSTTSHELRTPLTVISGYAELLAGGLLEESERHRALLTILRRSRQLDELLDRFLLTSRIVEGRVQLSPRPVDVGTLVARRAGAAAVASGRQVEVTVPDDLPPAHADESALGTVVDELVANAVKFSPGGGPVTVRVAAGTGRLLVQVEDRGIGMTTEQLDHCRERFWRLDDHRFGGAGIGLAIVDALVISGGGELRITSLAGHGTTVTVSVPVTPAAAGTSDRPAGASAPRPGRSDLGDLSRRLHTLG